MLNLILRCGGRAFDRAQIDRCVTPAPTDTWQLIPHAHLLEPGAAVTTVAHTWAFPHRSITPRSATGPPATAGTVGWPRSSS